MGTIEQVKHVDKYFINQETQVWNISKLQNMRS